MMRSTVLAGALAVGLCAPARAHAEACPAPDGAAASLASVDAAERYRFVRHTLSREARKGHWWTWGWGLGLGGATVGYYVAAPLTDEDAPRAEHIINGSKSALGVISTFVLRPQWYDVPDDNAAPDCAALARAEAQLAWAAERQEVSWVRHAETVALNATALLILGLGYDEWGRGALNAGLGVVVGELRLFTVPGGARRDWRRYRRGVLGSATQASWSVSPLPLADGVGISFALEL